MTHSLSITVWMHGFIAMLLLLLAYRLYQGIRKGKANFELLDSTVDDRMHLLDHLIGSGSAFVGACFSFTFTAVELVGYMSGTPYDLEIPTNMSFVVLLAGMIYLTWHFEKEETEGHPFFHWIGRGRKIPGRNDAGDRVGDRPPASTGSAP